MRTARALFWAALIFVSAAVIWAAVIFLGPMDRCLDPGGCWDDARPLRV
jgi:hypothetical protein